MVKFQSPRNIQTSMNADTNYKTIDEVFEVVIGDLHNDPAYIWNSAELHDLYVSYNGVFLSRRQLLKFDSRDRLRSDLLVLSGV